MFLEYCGFRASYYFVASTALYVGELINISDVVAFSAITLSELQKVMQIAVDNYLSIEETIPDCMASA